MKRTIEVGKADTIVVRQENFHEEEINQEIVTAKL